MGKDKRPNCYECVYRGTIPGDAHSRCGHPKVHVDDNPFGALVDMFAGKTTEARKELDIKGNPIGIRGGWFMWPANFDPTWLDACNGFKNKKEEAAVGRIKTF